MRPRAVYSIILFFALFITLPASQAQQPGRMYRIGYLSATTPSAQAGSVEAFRQGLRDHGYVEGTNLVIEYRWAEGKYDQLPGLAADLVRLKVDLIVTHGTPGSLAAKQATATIPIVMTVSGDAVETGIVASIARPGANITGSTFFFPDLNAKRVELLTEALPGGRRVAALVNPANPAHAVALKAMELMAKTLKVDFQVAEVRGPQDFSGVFLAMAKGRVDGVAVLDDPMLIANAREIADLALKNRLPTIGFRELADAGGLMAYAVNFTEFWRRAATFVDKILKGADPGELPIEQATKFELVIKRKTANALGLSIPPSLLLRADHVID